MRVLLISLFIVIADQLSKLYIKGFSIPFLNINHQGFFAGDQYDILGSFLRLTFVENPGMAFGIELGFTAKLLLSIFTLAASAGILYYIYKSKNHDLLFRVSLAIILGGAMGNLIDRLFYGVFYGYAPLFFGRVVDFIQINISGLSVLGYSIDQLPVFNLADIAVSVGVVMLLIFNRRSEIIEKKELESESAGSD